MHELACPACNTPSQYDFQDLLLMCPFCSVTFRVELETGQKEIFGDHFIVPNTADHRQIKDVVMEWLKLLHHNPLQAEKEFFVTNIEGSSIPFWVISLEAHTAWKGLIKKAQRISLESHPGSNYLVESGQFRRSYRWAVCGRKNLFETWGMIRLHEPQEAVEVDWDGFPLDSTLSRGRLKEMESPRSAYEVREFFEYKFANGLPIKGVQVSEDEALRRAKLHVDHYHYRLAQINADFLVDYRTELEVAGIQLLHLPFWEASYMYRPRTALRHFYKPKEKHLVLDGYASGVLKGELALVHRQKVWVNAFICAVAAIVLFLLGAIWHPAFYLVAVFALLVAGVSLYIALYKRGSHSLKEFAVEPVGAEETPLKLPKLEVDGAETSTQEG